MRDGKPNSPGRATAGTRRSNGPNRQRGFVERATAHGHSGHGSESVRPHLRDQLRLKALMTTPYPTPEDQTSKDEHHQ
jgi:hypothetical protein